MNNVLYCKVCEAIFNEDDINSTIQNINDTVRHMTPHHKTNCYFCDNPLYSTNTDVHEFITKYWETHDRNKEPWYAWQNLVRTMYLSENKNDPTNTPCRAIHLQFRYFNKYNTKVVIEAICKVMPF
jgi:hypothetical protein